LEKLLLPKPMTRHVGPSGPSSPIRSHTSLEAHEDSIGPMCLEVGP
jgi:hypothetical protein